MSDPGALTHERFTVHDAAAEERLAFIRRVYSFLLAGLFVCGMTVYAVATVPAVQSMAVHLYRLHPFLHLAVFMGAVFGARLVSERYPINIPVYFLMTAAIGLLLAPAALYAHAYHPGALSQAGVFTGVIFGGLTGYVFITRKDFSFLGSIVAVGTLALLAVGLVAVLFGGAGVGLWTWYSLAAVVLFAGWILYDTSNVLHRYGTDQYVTAAIALFVDVVILFKNLLFLFMRRD